MFIIFILLYLRAYYTGNNIYMLPSCISALMTFINFDFKYWAGKHPYELIKKYRSRGFAILLNNKEKNYAEYIYRIKIMKK